MIIKQLGLNLVTCGVIISDMWCHFLVRNVFEVLVIW